MFFWREIKSSEMRNTKKFITHLIPIVGAENNPVTDETFKYGILTVDLRINLQIPQYA